jgi:hypothetical protein
VFVCFDAFFQYFHSVQIGGVSGADSGVSFQIFPFDGFRTSCRIFRFYYFQFGMLYQEFTALCQGNGVGVDFCQCFPIVVRQAHEAVFDA